MDLHPAKLWCYFKDDQRYHCEAYSLRSDSIKETKVSINVEYLIDW